MKKIIKYVMLDILKNRIVLGYTFFLFLIAVSFFNLEDNSSKGLLGLLNIVLIIVPLISIIFSTIYIYNSNEFLELLVCQPIKRVTLLSSVYTGLLASLVISVFIGIGVPVLIYEPTLTGFILVIVAIILTAVFVSLALLGSVLIRDKAKGIGMSILLWFYFAIIFDGIILFLLFQFQDYPLEKTSIVLTMLNPIDMGRIMVLLQMDVAAMMGYTGAVFKMFFGSTAGIAAIAIVMSGWILLPAYWAIRKFNRKDL